MTGFVDRALQGRPCRSRLLRDTSHHASQDGSATQEGIFFFWVAVAVTRHDCDIVITVSVPVVQFE